MGKEQKGSFSFLCRNVHKLHVFFGRKLLENVLQWEKRDIKNEKEKRIRMKDSEKRIGYSGIFSVLALIAVAGMLVWNFFVGEQRFLSIVKLAKEMSQIVKESGMAEMHLLILHVVLMILTLAIFVVAFLFCVREVLALMHRAGKMEGTALWFVNLSTAFFALHIGYLFYQKAYDGSILVPSMGAELVCIGMVVLIALASYLVDKQDNMMRSSKGRMLSFGLLLLAILSMSGLGMEVFTLNQKSESDYHGYEGRYSMVELPADVVQYIEWVGNEEDTAVDLMMQRGSEIDRLKEEGAQINRAEDEELVALQADVVKKSQDAEKVRQLKLQVMISCILLGCMLVAYYFSLRNFVNGICGKSYDKYMQMIWSGVLFVAPWLYLLDCFLMKKQMTAIVGEIGLEGLFFLPLAAGFVFVVGSICKERFDIKELRMNRAVESARNRQEERSLHHYQQMFGDKPLGEYEQTQTAFTRRQGRNG